MPAPHTTPRSLLCALGAVAGTSVAVLAVACGVPADTTTEAEASSAATTRTVILIEDHADHAVERVVHLEADGTESTGDRADFRPEPPRQREHVLAVRVAWDATETICSASELQQGLFGEGPGEVAGWVRAASAGRAVLTGDVVGPIAVTRTPSCDPYAWSREVDAALEAQGVDLTVFTRRMYLVPGVACPWSGLAELGGRRAWINGGSCFHRPTLAHELGHTFGLHHASTPGAEYGDLSDPMGAGGSGLVGVNAPHALEVGWTVGAPPIELGTAYAGELIALAERDGPRVIRAAGLGPDTWFISYRSALGVDTPLSGAYVDKVAIHRARPGAFMPTVLEGLVAAGESLTVAGGLLTVQVRAAGRGAAEVEVSLGCAPAAPLVFLGGRVDVAPGGEGTTTLTVHNADTGACRPASLGLASAIGGGLPVDTTIDEPDLQLSFEPAHLVLATGESAQVTVRVTAAGAALPGAQVLPAKISRSGVAAAAFVVDAYVDSSAPEAPTGFVASVPNPHQNVVALELWAAPDDSGSLGLEVERDGAVVGAHPGITRGGLLSLTEKNVPVGMHTYRVRMFDPAGNRSGWSDPSTVVVRVRR